MQRVQSQPLREKNVTGRGLNEEAKKETIKKAPDRVEDGIKPNQQKTKRKGQSIK